MNTKKVMSAVTAAVLALQLSANSFNVVEAARGGYSCEAVANSDYKVKTENAVRGDYDTVSAPEGYVIVELWVKAGSVNGGGNSGPGCYGPFTQDGNDGSYNVTGIGTQTVEVERLDGAKDISHLEAIYAEATVDDEDEDNDPIDEEENEDEDTEEEVVEEENEEEDTTEEVVEEENEEEDTTEEVVEEENEEEVVEEEVENTEANEGEVLGVAAEVSEDAKQGAVLGAAEMADTGVSLAMLAQMGQIASIAVLAVNAVRKENK